jgi:hypothetical protein
MQHNKNIAAPLKVFGISLLLAGCGGGAGGQDPASAAADASQYEAMMEYCQAPSPDLGGPARDGFTSGASIHSGELQFDSNSAVSLSGSTVQQPDPVMLTVGIHDYRGVTGNFVPSGYAKPEWIMGAAIPTVFAAKSVACVAQLAKIKSTAAYPFPGLPTPAPSIALSWTSYWQRAIPVDRLPGQPIDGVEFVSNFVPLDGQVFFTLNKAAFASPQGMSICYLAPSAAQWACAPASSADRGENWWVYQRGVRPGAYVLVAPRAG